MNDTLVTLIAGGVIVVVILLVVTVIYLGIGMLGLWAVNQFGYLLPWTWEKAIAGAVIAFLLSLVFSR
jgi:hypothetical protein